MSSIAIPLIPLDTGCVISNTAYENPSPSSELAAEKKANHRANLVRISQVFPHPDPATTNLELIMIDGYQVVVRKGAFFPGALGVYVQPDSIVPQTEPFRFIWEQYVGIDGLVPEKRRRITVRKFRGQWSEGLLLPVQDFGLWPTRDTDGSDVVTSYDIATQRQFIFRVGDDLSGFLGVTHYDPDAGTEATAGQTAAAPRRKYPKTLKGFFWFVLSLLGFKKARRNLAQEVSFHLPEYDVEAFKNHPGTFTDGEQVVITEKIHGSNARFVCIDETMYAGSRTQWKRLDSGTIWARALETISWITYWCQNHPGYALYGEVTPTQKGFDYGAKEVQFFLFDILDPNGKWVPLEKYADFGLADYEGSFLNGGAPEEMVPVLYTGPYSQEIALKYVDGPSVAANGKHIREGIVIRSVEENGRLRHGRKQLKIVSNAFLKKDSEQ